MTQYYKKCIHNWFLSTAKLKNRKLAGAGIGIAATVLTASELAKSEDNFVGIRSVVRFTRSIKIGFTISLDYYFSILGLSERSPNYEIMMSRIHQRCAERIRDGCLQNGGTYVKLGQGLVSLSHILPKQYIETLKVLQDKCLTRSTEELSQIFNEDFSTTPEELFESFDSTPIAAASIAQVFKATTKEGETVAVKVQYKDLINRLSGDVMTINILLKIGAYMHPKVDFTWILNDFVDALKQELDFINEGLNGEKCANDLKNLKYVYVPKILWKYTSTRVLVTEFVDGIKISDTNELIAKGFSLQNINNKLFEAFGYQIFQTGFVHADPHPGNVMVRTQNEKLELIILDHGLYQKVSEKDRLNLSYFWKAIVLGSHQEMQKYSKLLGVDDYIMFAEILTQAPLRSIGFKLKAKLTKSEEKHMREMAAARFDEIVTCLQQMPRTLLLVVRNLNTIRAIAHDHGNPINRFSVLARIATKAAFRAESSTLAKRIITFPSKVWFEISLMMKQIFTIWRALVYHIVLKLYKADDIKSLLQDATNKLYTI